jgi:hypothetical protein
MYIGVLGAWIAVFLTLSILSYLYKDNVFYKLAEHIFVGVSAAHWATIAFWNQVQPNLFGRLWPQVEVASLEGFNKFWYSIYHVLHVLFEKVFPEQTVNGALYRGIGDQPQNLTYIFAFILGLFMLFRLIPKIGWLSRWSLAYVIGMAAGLRLYGYMSSDVIGQIHATMLPLWTGNLGDSINNIILIVGVLTGLFYFFFSVEHKGALKVVSRIGIYFLMIYFGASFGFAVMGRISLLIGRFNDLIEYSGKQYGFATPILLVIMIVVLILTSRKEKRSEEAEA